MAYNKSKIVEAAQKLLNQGKVPQAIAEYQQILKHEPKDQVTLMTIGELYIRQGEPRQAIEYFERLAHVFVNDGFLTKAIAAYKRIVRLVPEEIRPLEKLADLYVQQGVMSEARPLFLQLAEMELKGGRQAEAVVLLKKLLAAEPDNLRIQIRLADLYQAMGQTKEAVEANIEAAQRAMARGEQAESERLAEKVLKLDPQNVAAITVKVRVYAAQGKHAEAAALLERLPDLEKGGEQAELLLDQYRKSSQWDEATKLALRVFEADRKNYGLVQKVAEGLLEAGQGERAMALIEQIHMPLLDAGEHEAITKLLNDLIAGLPTHLEPHEWLVDTYGRTSDSFRLPDALANFGDALVAAGEYNRAKEIFQQLVERQPDSESARRKLNDTLRMLGAPVPEEKMPRGGLEEVFQIEAQQPPTFLQEAFQVEFAKESAQPVLPREERANGAEAKPAPPPEEQLDEETQQFISQSLTDVDLFASYGLSHKAIGLLDAVLRRAPRHTPTLEKLLDFVLGAGDDRRTAELAAQLEQIHRGRGDEHNAERFGELRRRFQRAAGLSDADVVLAAASAPPAPEPLPAAQEPAPPTAQVPEPEPAAQAPTPPPAIEVPVQLTAEPAAAVHEVDLSDEWAAMVGTSAPAEAPPKVAAQPPVAPPAVTEVTEFQVPAAAEEASPSAEIAAEIPNLLEEAPPAEKPVSKRAAPPKKKEPVAAEPVFELEQDYDLVLEPEQLVPTHEQMAPPPAAVPPKQAQEEPAATFSSDQFLKELASELDQLGLGELAPEAPKSAPAAKAEARPAKPAAAPAAPGGSGDHTLQELFDEFREEIGELSAEDEDLETHYNLGIAFREMGLLEEAISEFQKVAKANDHGRAFRYAMQCCTLLGLAFMEKGQPAIAAHWYERALQTPDLDPESVLALRYDLGVAQESAGELEAALKSFSKVYASNIDYRDVGERIATLEKTAR